jgi:hypothetical protein
MFYATNECDNDSKEWHFLLKWMINVFYKKKCDTNKNMTKMDVIIKGRLLYDFWVNILLFTNYPFLFFTYFKITITN